MPLPEGKSYLGFIFARGAGACGASIARCATRTRDCEFVVDRELAVVVKIYFAC